MPFRYSAFTLMTPEYTLEEAAALLARLGYNGVEWRVHSVPSQMPEKIDFWMGNRATVDIDTIVAKADTVRKLSEDAGLSIVGLGTYLSYKLIDDVERCMEAARIMGCDSIRVSAPKYDGSENYNDLYEQSVEGYGRIEELARDYRVRANIEIHHGNICCSASLAYRLVSNFDPDFVGVIFDPGNMAYEGFENWQLSLELLGPYLAYVHVKNAEHFESGTTPDGAKQWSTRPAPLKEGIVQWREVIAALVKVGYEGWLSMEDFGPGDTQSKLADNLAYISSLEDQPVA